MDRKKIIGVSTHTPGQAQKAQDAGADYIGFGPIFNTATKNAGTPRGLKALEKTRRQISLPIIAIGGITSGNIAGVLSSGADAAAVVSGILRGDIKANVGKYLSSIRQTAGSD
jgi:thiamine-phosphate diphosphorylase